MQAVRQHWPLRTHVVGSTTVIPGFILRLERGKSPVLCWPQNTQPSSPNWVPVSYSVSLGFKFSLPFRIGSAWPGQGLWSFCQLLTKQEMFKVFDGLYTPFKDSECLRLGSKGQFWWLLVLKGWTGKRKDTGNMAMWHLGMKREGYLDKGGRLGFSHTGRPLTPGGSTHWHKKQGVRALKGLLGRKSQASQEPGNRVPEYDLELPYWQTTLGDLRKILLSWRLIFRKEIMLSQLPSPATHKDDPNQHDGEVHLTTCILFKMIYNFVQISDVNIPCSSDFQRQLL